MLIRKVASHPLYNRKIRPGLTRELMNQFNADLWEIIAAYLFDLEIFNCPLSGLRFTDPVYIEHPKLKPIIYDERSIVQQLSKLKQEYNCFQIIPISFIERFKKLTKTIELSGKYLRELEAADLETNLEEDYRKAVRLAVKAGYTHFDVVNFVNNYDCPISARHYYRQFEYLSKVWKKRITYLCSVLGAIAAWNKVDGNYSLMLPTMPLFIFMVLHWRNLLISGADFILRESDGINYLNCLKNQVRGSVKEYFKSSISAHKCISSTLPRTTAII